MEDYYDFLMMTERLIPPEQTVQLFIPEYPVSRHAFLREKGRYFLYPRNFGNNARPADFVLQYGVPVEALPAGLVPCRIYSPEKGLWAYQHCPGLNDSGG